jgi:uncharacterized protein (DUF924 family)
VTPHAIIDFWEKVVGKDRWYAVEPALDDAIRKDYRAVWDDARAGKFADWEDTPEGALALLIVLDQFPRNMFRGHADAFASDAQARAVAHRTTAHGFDLKIAPPLRQFFYTPFEHSEDFADQDRALMLTGERLGVDYFTYPFIVEHRDEIARFGRFPSRNKALGRTSTPEELAFLSERLNRS